MTIQAQILDVFGRIQKNSGWQPFFISHDLGVVAGVADRVAVMYAGKIVEIGTAEEIFMIQGIRIHGDAAVSSDFVQGKEWLPALPGMPQP